MNEFFSTPEGKIVLTELVKISFVFLKDGVKVTALALKEKIKSAILTEEECEKISKSVNSLPEEVKQSEQALTENLKSNKEIERIFQTHNQFNQSNITFNNSQNFQGDFRGSTFNFGGSESTPKKS